MSEIVIRHAESTDAQALGQLYAQVPVYSDTLQLPYPPAALWEGRLRILLLTVSRWWPALTANWSGI